MRRFIFVGVLASVALSGAPAAQASDDSVRAVVRAQAERQVKEDARFGRALRNLDSRAGLNRARRAIGRQAASIKVFKAALLPERADTQRVAEGRRELLDALNVYTRGLRNLQ